MSKIKVNKVLSIDYGTKKDYITVEFVNGITLKRSAHLIENTLKKEERYCDFTGRVIPKGSPVYKMQANYKGMSVYFFSPDCLSEVQDDDGEEKVSSVLLKAIENAEQYFMDKHEGIIKDINKTQQQLTKLKNKKDRVGTLVSKAYKLLEEVKKEEG